MAASTTLMTFMVRTPATTHSVDLYGSWDNFTTPYRMSRDVRLGREHWSGCHSFNNIICDGNVNDLGVPRKGGLKMGGTYWYYYKLDDEIEFHNAAEPATTRCPLLPGQIVNELEVPFALSGNRRHDASICSTSSERHTLDPEAKFSNPRPAPAAPTLTRLNTSPTFPLISLTSSDLHHDLFTSQPASHSEYEASKFDSSRIFHLPRMPSLDGLHETGSEKKQLAGLRKPFKRTVIELSPTQRGRYQDIYDWIPDRATDLQKGTLAPVDKIKEPKDEEVKPARRALLLRSISDDVLPLAGFREHRRQQSRSHSRGETPRNPMVFDEAAQLDLRGKGPNKQGPLSALFEVNTPGSTPLHGLMTGRRIALEALEGRHETEIQLEKRLPTLPNTPSSVYPPTTMEDSPPRDGLSRIDILNSHFSTTTIDTTCDLDSVLMTEEDRQIFDFVATENISLEMDITAGDVSSDAYVTRDHFGLLPNSVYTKPAVPCGVLYADEYHGSQVTSVMSHERVGSPVSTTPTTSYGESESVNSSRFSPAPSIRSSRASYGNFQHYSLPEIENASEVTLKYYDTSDRAIVGEGKDNARQQRNSLSHSESMQQLLHELSYLSAMIQQ